MATVSEDNLIAYFASLSVPEKLRVATVFRWLRANFSVTATEAWSTATELHAEAPEFFEKRLQLQDRKETPDRQFALFVGQAHRL